MIKISFFLFREYKDRISTENVQRSLELVGSVINFSNGKMLNRNKVNLIYKRLGSRMQGTTLYPGGSSSLFAWSFYLDNVGSIIFKPYYNRELFQLIIHYIIVQDHRKDLFNTEFESENTLYHVSIPDLVGIAKIESEEKLFPVLIVKEVKGNPIHLYPSLIKNVSKVARNFAKNNVICDPYPENWLLSSVDNTKTIYYIDLLSSNSISDPKNRIASLLEKLE